MTLDEAIKHCYEKADCSECGQEHKQLGKWLEELKHYKQLEETGRLIELSCVPNETVWCADEYNTRPVLYGSKSSILYDIECFKGIEYTKEEAEEKLKELKGKQE